MFDKNIPQKEVEVPHGFSSFRVTGDGSRVTPCHSNVTRELVCPP